MPGGDRLRYEAGRRLMPPGQIAEADDSAADAAGRAIGSSGRPARTPREQRRPKADRVLNADLIHTDRRGSASKRRPRRGAAVLLAALLSVAAAAAQDGSDGGIPELDRIEGAIRQVVERVAPSTVGIRVERRFVTPLAEGVAPLTAREQIVTVNGSGTIIDSDGLILTNEHVVQAATLIEVLFHDGGSVRATVRSSDARSDLAVLEVPRRGLHAAAYGDVSGLTRGQWVIALGNPFGLGGDGSACVSVGVISNLNRRLPGLGAVDDRLYHDMIQTTASINPGNSGGPLFNTRGELIGVVTAMHTRAAVDEGVGFAIPLTPAKRTIVERLSRGETIEYGYLGLAVRDPSGAERQAAALASGGAYVEEVEVGGPAQRAGVRTGDLVVSFDGQALRNAAQFMDLVGQSPVGQTVPLELRRQKSPMRMTLTVERREVSRVAWMRGSAILWRGLRLADVSPEAHQRSSIEEGRGVVVIDILKDSTGHRAGIRVGDVIEAVGDERVTGVGDFRERTRARKGVVQVTLRARGQVSVQP